MTAVERLTIDMTVVHDLYKPSNPRHQQAQELFDLADKGEVELMVAPQGGRDDIPEGWLAEELRALVASGRVTEAAQLAYVSEQTLLPLVVGEGVEDFREAWQQTLDTWRTHESGPPGDKDLWHAETHVNEKADVLITDDGPLRVMCRRLCDEHDIPIAARGLEEYLEGRSRAEE
jgi:hypothetical protein